MDALRSYATCAAQGCSGCGASQRCCVLACVRCVSGRFLAVADKTQNAAPSVSDILGIGKNPSRPEKIAAAAAPAARVQLSVEGCCSLSRCEGAMALLRTTALALALGSANAGGAYPDLQNGAQYLKLTDATFDSFINDALAAGKTAMVRWIASEG